jgi:hypothetical protein
MGRAPAEWSGSGARCSGRPSRAGPKPSQTGHEHGDQCGGGWRSPTSVAAGQGARQSARGRGGRWRILAAGMVNDKAEGAAAGAAEGEAVGAAGRGVFRRKEEASGVGAGRGWQGLAVVCSGRGDKTAAACKSSVTVGLGARD